MRKIAFCENCQSVMKPTEASQEKQKEIEEKLNSAPSISKSQKKLEFFLEVWKCDCPKTIYIISTEE